MARERSRNDKKKMGRPTKNPKNIQTRIRMTEDEKAKLDFCAEKLCKTKTQILMDGLKLMYEKATE